MKKIRILHVIGSLRMGGAETVALNYFKYIDKSAFSCDYLIYGSEIGELENKVVELGGRVIRISEPQKGYVSFYKHLKNVMRIYGPYDVVHSHTLYNSGMVMMASYFEKVPKRISHAHSSRAFSKKAILKKVYIMIMRKLIVKYSTNMLACSVSAGEYLFGANIFQKSGMVLNNGIDVSRYEYNEIIRTDIRKTLNIENSFVIGHVGRLCDVKNQEFLLEVFHKVKERHFNSKLILVGDGKIKESLIEKAKILKIYEDVIFMGIRDDVYDLLQGMDIFVFPSKYEGLGIAVIEAQTSGLACIISDTIPQEVDVTNLVNRISLTKPSGFWADYILKYVSGYERNNCYNDYFYENYDVNSIVNMLDYLYKI